VFWVVRQSHIKLCASATWNTTGKAVGKFFEMIIPKSIKGGGAFSKIATTWELRKRKKSGEHAEMCVCDCRLQTCKGLFVRKFDWQTHCPWEMLRLGIIKDFKEISEGRLHEKKGKIDN